jgi:hypothetical protein
MCLQMTWITWSILWWNPLTWIYLGHVRPNHSLENEPTHLNAILACVHIIVELRYCCRIEGFLQAHVHHVDHDTAIDTPARLHMSLLTMQQRIPLPEQCHVADRSTLHRASGHPSPSTRAVHPRNGLQETPSPVKSHQNGRLWHSKRDILLVPHTLRRSDWWISCGYSALSCGEG